MEDTAILSDRDRVGRILRQAGLPLHGFCPFAAVADRLLPCRAAARLPEGSRTVIVALFPYRFPEEGRRNLSRYACVPDYHQAAGRVLQGAAAALAEAFNASFEAFIDNSPIPEVYAAASAGLGRMGDNGLLLHPVYGSWVFIGCIVTDMELEARASAPAACLHCGACGTACPGGCVGGADKPRRCLSAVSQKKGPLEEAEERLLAGSPLVWGCDTCQEVCPLNRDAKIDPHPCFGGFEGWLDRAVLDALDREGLRRKAYGWRGRAVVERNLSIWDKRSRED